MPKKEVEVYDPMKDVPTFWDLPYPLQQKLSSEFSVYVLRSIKFRHWVMFFSFWALAFQTDKLLDQYLEFDTVVKVEIKKPYYIFMPGVMVCTNKYHMVLKSKLRDRYPQLDAELKEKSRTDEEEMDVYRKWKEIAHQNSTVSEWYSLMADPQDVLDCKLINMPLYHQKHNLSMPDCYNMSKILYTLPRGIGICWSFFSQVNPQDYRERDWVLANDWYKIEVEAGILASFYIHFDAFYQDKFVKDKFPDDMDDTDKGPELASIITYAKAVYPVVSLDRATLKPGLNYELQFGQTNARMLNVPYHTDCRNYEQEGHWKQYKSNYHCLNGCLQKYMKKCNCTYERSQGERISLLPANDSWDYNAKFCVDKLSENPEDWCTSRNAFMLKYMHSECQLTKWCKNHCFEEYYRYEVIQMFYDEEIDGKGEPENADDIYFYKPGLPEFKKAQPHQNYSTLRIKRKDISDVTYEHTADMIFVEFVCYFGGLLGLWLGVSILDVYHQCLIWYAQAPGEYRRWLVKQTLSDDIQRIRVEESGRIVVLTPQEVDNNIKSNVSVFTTIPMSKTDYNTEFGTSFGTNFSNKY